MNSIQFQIPMKPISLNNSHRLVRFGNRPSRIKTEAAKKFEAMFLHYLLPHTAERDKMLNLYNDKHHGIHMEAFFYINEDEYFAKPKTKKSLKTISKRAIDLDNALKVSTDSIFKWLGLDDSQIVSINCSKIPTNDHPTMAFRLSLVKFPELFVVHVGSV